MIPPEQKMFKYLGIMPLDDIEASTWKNPSQFSRILVRDMTPPSEKVTKALAYMALDDIATNNLKKSISI